MKVFAWTTAAALAALMIAGPAAADPVVAKLQTPVPSAAKKVAGGAVFDCLGDLCAARSPAGDTAGLRACKDLVRQTGPVVSFGPNSKPMAGDEISACNESAKK